MPNCKKCGEPIVWNHQDHEKTGKWRPFDEETDEPHNCSASDYYTGERGGRGMDGVDSMAMSNAINNLEDKMDEVKKTVLQILSAVQTLQIRVEGQMPLFPTTASPTITAVEAYKPINESEVVALSEAGNEDAVRSGGNRNADIST